MHFHLVIYQLTVTWTVTQASIKLKMGYSIENMNHIFISGRPTRALVEIAKRLSANKLDWSERSVNYRKSTYQNKAWSKLSARMMTYERGNTEYPEWSYPVNRPHPLSKLRKIKMNSTKTKSSRSSRFQSLTPRIFLSLSYDTLTAHLLLLPSLGNLAHGETRLPGLGCSKAG